MLSTKTWEEVTPKFRSWYLGRESKRDMSSVQSGEICTGVYTVFKGGNVRVEIAQPWCDVFFEVRVAEGRGNTRMTFERHYSVSRMNAAEPVFFEVPECFDLEQTEGVFRFHGEQRRL